MKDRMLILREGYPVGTLLQAEFGYVVGLNKPQNTATDGHEKGYSGNSGDQLMVLGYFSVQQGPKLVNYQGLKVWNLTENKVVWLYWSQLMLHFRKPYEHHE